MIIRLYKLPSDEALRLKVCGIDRFISISPSIGLYINDYKYI